MAAGLGISVFATGHWILSDSHQPDVAEDAARQANHTTGRTRATIIYSLQRWRTAHAEPTSSAVLPS